MNPLVDRRTRFLQCQIFLTTKHIEGADRRGQVFIPKYERTHGLEYALSIQLLREMPFTGDKRNNRIAAAFHDCKIEGITVTRRITIRRAARILSKLYSENVEVEIFDSP